MEADQVTDEDVIKPLIKWTGGKYREFPYFKSYIPEFNRYFEPFAGGAGVFFALKPPGESYLNDKSTDLIRFYRLIGNPSFITELTQYADAWDDAGKLARTVTSELNPVFLTFIETSQSPEKTIQQTVKKIDLQQFPALFNVDFILQPSAFQEKLNYSLFDKMKRIRAISKKEIRSFEPLELHDHIETAVKSCLYLFMRGLLNDNNRGIINFSKTRAGANWFFVREFCYGSMFRYNRQGDFNIPYGGIAYNKKNFRAKIQHLSGNRVNTLFQNTTFYNLDFQDFINSTKPAKGDFLFLDPPYDSEFSEYDQHIFDRNDQKRLQEALMQQSARWMLVIKKTGFIQELYTKPGITIKTFDKRYTYNVRGRNSREAEHLVIMNYKPYK